MNRSRFSARIHLWFQHRTNTHTHTHKPWRNASSVSENPPHHNAQEQHITATIRLHTFTSYDNSFEHPTYVGSETRRRKNRKGKRELGTWNITTFCVRWCNFSKNVMNKCDNCCREIRTVRHTTHGCRSDFTFLYVCVCVCVCLWCSLCSSF